MRELGETEPGASQAGTDLATSPTNRSLTPEPAGLSYDEVIALMWDYQTPSVTAYPKALSENPYAEVSFIDASTPHNPAARELTNSSRIVSIRFRAGEIAVGNAALIPTQQKEKCALLASVGLTNEVIGSSLFLTEATIKTHLQHFYNNRSIQGRSHIARTFFETGHYRITTHDDELELRAAELPIIELCALGMNNKAIAHELGLSPLTIKSHLANVSFRNDLYNREQLVMAALLSGQVDYSRPVREFVHD